MIEMALLPKMIVVRQTFPTRKLRTKIVYFAQVVAIFSRYGMMSGTICCLNSLNIGFCEHS
jgi:hypothetical protein